MKQLLLFFSLAFALNAFPDSSVEVMTTCANGQILLKTQQLDLGSALGTANSIITLDADKKYQTMDGFGFALTYSACYNLMKMTAQDRHDLLVKTFSPTDGYGANYVRMSIACSDFSSECYTYCEKKGPSDNLLANFTLHDDELSYVIPVMQEVLAINPDIKIMAAPWTAPRWMKQKSVTDASAWNYYAGGVLNPTYYEAYAQYFVKFVQVMKTYGINIYAVTPQNEPLNAGNCASTYIGAKQEADFIKHLAPAFHNAGITTKIYVFDHNYNYDNKSEENDYPVQVYNALSPTIQGYDLVKGCAWHDYGGNYTEMDDIQEKAPNMEQIFTETSIGSWNDGRNLRSRLVNDFNRLLLHLINRYGRATMVWNFMLDLNYGPYTQAAGSCTTCMGAIDIDQRDYKTLHYNSHYYLICHASKVVRTGAYRIGNSISATQDGLLYSTFLNTDGTYSLLLSNNSSNDYIIGIRSSKEAPVTHVSVPAKSVVSVSLEAQEQKEHAHLLNKDELCPLCSQNNEYYANRALASNVVRIGSADELLAFAKAVNEGDLTRCGLITQDIDLQGKQWTPIGKTSANYKGTFDGGLHNITHLNGMLFGTTYGATIKNVVIESGEIQGNEEYATHTGSIIGNAQKSTMLTHSCSKASVTCSSGDLGGLVGKMNGTIEDCFFCGTLDGANANYMGGIIGSSSAMKTATINNCFSSADYTASALKGQGALVGNFYSGNTLTNSYATPTEVCPKLVGNGSGISTTTDAFKTPEEFASGEVCYNLNNGAVFPIFFFQTIGEDTFPTFSKTHQTVFANGEQFISLQQDKEGYFLISDANGFNAFANTINAGTSNLSGRLTNDIDFRNISQITIGTAEDEKNFCGRFDGQHHLISNISSMLFGTVKQALIENVAIQSGTIKGNSTYAAHTGSLAGNCKQNTIIRGCSSNANITTATGDCGGLAGKLSGTMNSCFYGGNMNVSAYTQGGLIGSTEPDATDVLNSFVIGTIKENSTGQAHGNIAGWSHKGSIFKDCYPISTTGLSKMLGADEGGTSTNIVKKPKTSFTSGEVAYLLHTAGGNVFQTLGEDNMPVLNPTHLPVAHSFKTGTNGWASVSSPYALYTNKDLETYYVCDFNDTQATLVLTKIGETETIPAKEGFLVKGGNAKTYYMNGSYQDAFWNKNLLIGSWKGETQVESGYILSSTNKDVVFEKVEQTTLPQYQAYLKLNSQNASFRITEEELQTSIQKTQDSGVPVSIYNLNGHQLSGPQNGINIVKKSNGTVQKIVVPAML